MTTPHLQDSPRLAKITSSAQQFRELINSLRNNQIRTRHPQISPNTQLENSPKNDSQLLQQPIPAPSEKPQTSSNLF
jgi:hypothetical protein